MFIVAPRLLCAQKNVCNYAKNLSEILMYIIKVGALCNGDYDRDLKFDVFDWEMSGSHRPMGTFHSTLRNTFSFKECLP